MLAKILMAIITAIGFMFFLSFAVKIEWTIYIGIILIVLTGSVGIAFIVIRIEAIICGVIVSVFIPVILELLKLYRNIEIKGRVISAPAGGGG